MIYFAPNWKQETEHLDRDRILNIIQLYQENNEDYKILLVYYVPFLRYQLQEYLIYPSHYFNLFDRLQKINILEGFPLGIDDFIFPKDIEKIYTPFGLTLLRNSELYGEILYNRFGFIEQIHYFNEEKTIVESYDDRGFLSSKVYIEKETTIKKEYFNELGEKTIIEYFGEQPHVRIPYYLELGLEHEEFPTLTDAVAAMLRLFVEQNSAEQFKLITTSDLDLLAINSQLQKYSKIFRIFSADDSLDQYSLVEQEVLLKNSSYFITDSHKKESELKSLIRSRTISDLKVQDVPMYNMKLSLGQSNSISQLIIYWRMDGSHEENEDTHAVMIKQLIEKEKCSLIIEVDSPVEEAMLRQQQKMIIDSFYKVDSHSTDFLKVKKFLEAKRAKKLFKSDEDAIKDLRKSDAWKPLVAAIDAYSRLTIRVLPALAEIKQDLQVTRLYIDVSESPDLQRQILSISAGIPQISSQKTDFILEKENGIVIKKMDELPEAIDYFLDHLKNWNQALVSNIQLLDNYRPEKIMGKWREIVNGETEED